jgi:threonine dehydrogenase-like Zn-dependent dehydrogenase
LVEPCDRVAVVGDGKLGLLIAEVLGRHVHALTPKAPPLVLLGRHTSKMGLLSADAGVETALAADALPARAACFDVVVDATGSPAGLGLARQLLRPLGTLVLKSTCAAGADFNTAPFVVDELKVVGSRCGPFPPALKLLECGLDLTKLIDATYPLAEAADAVAKAATKGTMKVQIRVSAD